MVKLPKPIELDPGLDLELAPGEVHLQSFDGTHAAVDIPLEVLASLILEVLKRDLASPTKTEAIFDAAAQSLGRLGVSVPTRVQ